MSKVFRYTVKASVPDTIQSERLMDVMEFDQIKGKLRIAYKNVLRDKLLFNGNKSPYQIDQEESLRTDRVFKDMGDTVFEKFVMMHVIIGSSDLMPTIMTIYQDDTFELDTFNSDIKTTIYRKINENANKIANEDVKEVFWMQTYSDCPLSDNTLMIPAKDRANKIWAA